MVTELQISYCPCLAPYDQTEAGLYVK